MDRRIRYSRPPRVYMKPGSAELETVLDLSIGAAVGVLTFALAGGVLLGYGISRLIGR